MKSTLEGIQPADGEVRVADGLHQRQLGLHPGERVEAVFWLEVRLACQSLGRSLKIEKGNYTTTLIRY